VAVAGAVLLGPLAGAQPGGAVVSAVIRGNAPLVACSSLKGSDIPGKTLTLTGCSGPTGGSAVVAAPFFAPRVIHWANGGSTTVTFNGNVRPHSIPACATAVTPRQGRVIASSISSTTTRFRASLCLRASGISLLPGTAMTF